MNQRRMAIALSPLVVALALGGWLLWAGADPARQSGFCANPTMALATISQLDGRRPAQLLPLVSDQDLGRLEVRTPADLRPDARAVVTGALRYRRARPAEAAPGRPAPAVPADLARRFGRLMDGYAKRCLTPSRP